MVWGCFIGRGKGKLVMLPPNIKVNQFIYLELLLDNLPELLEMTRAKIFQQDGPPCHTLKYVMSWLKNCEVPFIEDWPGNSLDINSIEKMWQIIKKKLRGKG